MKSSEILAGRGVFCLDLLSRNRHRGCAAEAINLSAPALLPPPATPSSGQLFLSLPDPAMLERTRGLPPAPHAERRPKTSRWHGITLTDDYAWLRADNWREVMR